MKRVEDSGIQRDNLTGASGSQEMKAIAKEIRLHIFSEETLRLDNSETPEEGPTQDVTVSGLGSSGFSGKYEGFGNSPIQNGRKDSINLSV